MIDYQLIINLVSPLILYPSDVEWIGAEAVM
jgi:hypothetical protein